jgi:uncharacterized Zn finger protein
MPDYRDFRYHGPPREVRGGIKAQTSRGTFGRSWWGRRWLETLENFEIGTRLQRGKTYARQGQVISVEVSEGKVEASVQGSLKEPYAVTIEMKTIALAEWQELARTSFNQALVAARLLSGVMPENVENLFGEKKLSLFPERIADLKTHCSCPDHSNPCKHIAAVYYLLAEEFDREPFLIFKLRGMSRLKLLRLIFSSLASGEIFSKGLEPTDNKIDKRRARPTDCDTLAHLKKESVKENTAGVPLKHPEKLPFSSAPKTNGQLSPQTTKKMHVSSPPQISEQSKSAVSSKDRNHHTSTAIEFLPNDPEQFWQRQWIDRQSIPPAKMPQTTARLLKTIGSPPFWRAEEKFMEAMTSVYEGASKYAKFILKDE